MKLLVKKEYFDEIKSGEKQLDWRDAHITFVCEETGETVTKDVVHVDLVDRAMLPESLRGCYFFEDDRQIVFGLGMKNR